MNNYVSNTVEVCIYCNQEVKETYCCIWSYYQIHTKSDNFSTHDFKNLVSGSYKVKNKTKSKKRSSIKYDPTSFHLHTKELGAITLN